MAAANRPGGGAGAAGGGNDPNRPQRINLEQNLELFHFFGTGSQVSRNHIPSTDDLERAINQGDLGRTRYMFDVTKHKLQETDENYNLLKHALSKDQVGFFYLLVDQGAPVVGFEEPGQTTFLHYAAEKNNKKLAQTLIAHEVDKLAINESSETPLHVATKQDNRKVLYYLIDALSNEERISIIIDNEGLTLFHILCTAPKSEHAHTFLQFQPTTAYDINETLSIDSNFCPGYSALHLASQYYRLETVKILIENGADMNAVTTAGLTGLHFACQISNLLGILSEVTMDITEEMDDSTRKSHCSTNLTMIFSQRFMLIDLFLNFDCDVDSRDKDGNNALMFVVQNKYPDSKEKSDTAAERSQGPLLQPRRVMEALRAGNLRFEDIAGPGINLNVGVLRRDGIQIPIDSDFYINDLLHSNELKKTLEKEQLTVMKLLIKRYNNHLFDLNFDSGKINVPVPLEGINYTNNFGRTCLHHLALLENTPSSILLFLLKCGADVNIADKDGRTPLHIAAENGNKSFIEVLVKNNSNNWNKMLNVNAEDNEGNTPLRLIKLPIKRDHGFSKQNECFCLLLKAGADIYEEKKDDAHEFSSEVRGHVLQMIMNKDFSKMMSLFKEKKDFDTEAMASYLKEVVQNRVHIEIIELIVKYLEMLQACNCINLKLHYNFFDKVTKKFYSTPEDLKERVTFESSCKEEVDRMKETKIDESFSLCDLVKKKSDDIVPYTETDKLKEILSSQDFENLFPVYGTMLKARYVCALRKRLQKQESAAEKMQVEIEVS